MVTGGGLWCEGEKGPEAVGMGGNGRERLVAACGAAGGVGRHS